MSLVRGGNTEGRTMKTATFKTQDDAYAHLGQCRVEVIRQLRSAEADLEIGLGPMFRCRVLSTGEQFDAYKDELSDECEDCNGTGKVPSIGPEEGEDEGYVDCPTCKGVTS